jgi:3-oxoacyl-[acyl-carrier-protein] synthase III
MSADPDIATADAMVQSALRALSQTLRYAAELDLVVDLTVSRQDLQDDVNVRIGTAPHVDVTLRRHEGPDVDPEE